MKDFALLKPIHRTLLPIALLALSILDGCHSSTSTTPTPDQLPPIASVAAHFVDVTDSAGLTYQWTIPGSRPLDILETIGNGCAFLDYDGDGNLDILLVGSTNALFKGDGHGHFADVSAQTGVDKIRGHYLGCAVGDYDNDGSPDIYLYGYKCGALLHNNAGSNFADISAAAGIAPQPWATSAAFIDIDNDGKLDLYVGDYLDFTAHSRLCKVNNIMTSCGPRYYPALIGHLYHNSGNGRFADVTNAWNAQKIFGKTLGIAVADFNATGRQSMYMANDAMAGNLLRNEGAHFKDEGMLSGTAVDIDGNAANGMGVDWGDYDNDGKLDLCVGTFSKQPDFVFHNDGNDLFSEQSAALGVSQPTIPYVTFGLKWLDYDNDGWLDLVLVNGHVQDNIEKTEASATYREPTLLMHNEQGHHFSNASTGLIGDAGKPIVGRGVAVGDYDNDGRVDMLIVDSEGKPLLLHNETPSTGNWLEVNLEGTKSNRDGQGALVTAEAGTVKLLRNCTTTGSYMSASDRRVHFGLGTSTSVDTLTIKWPKGDTQTLHGVKANQILTVHEP